LAELILAPASIHRSFFFSLLSPSLTKLVKLGEEKKLAPPALERREKKKLR